MLHMHDKVFFLNEICLGIIFLALDFGLKRHVNLVCRQFGFMGLVLT